MTTAASTQAGPCAPSNRQGDRRPPQAAPGGLPGLVCALAMGLPFVGSAAAQVAEIDVLDARVTIAPAAVEIELRVPVQALLGFAHRPRSAREREDAVALRNGLSKAPTLLTPNAAAGCELQTLRMDDRALWPAGESPPGPPTSMVALKYDFDCKHPSALSVLELTVFKHFPRVQRVRAEVQSGPRAYQRDARRPLEVLPLD